MVVMGGVEWEWDVCWVCGMGDGGWRMGDGG